jgi:hypothetical protein
MNQLLDSRTASRLRAFLLSENQRRVTWATVGALTAIALVAGALLAYLTPVGGVAVMIAGVAALLMLRDVRWGLYALVVVICLLPFASLPFKIGFTPTFLDLVLLALYAVWGMRLITRRQQDFILTPLGLPVLAFVLLAMFSFLLGLSHARPTANDLRTFAEVLMGIGMFFLVVNNVREESLLRQLTALLVLIGTIEAAIGVLLYGIPPAWAVQLLSPLGRLGYPVGYGALRFINDDPSRPMRAIGTSVDPNILGALLVIIISVAAAQLFAKRPVLPRTWIALSLAVMGLCLFLTYSRGSMVGVTAALLLLGLLKYRRLLLVLAVGALIVLVLPQTQAYVLNFVQGIQFADRSTQMRMGEYQDALKLIARYPWVGVGFVGTPDIDLYLAVASIYFTLAGQMGIVGVIAFLVVMVAYFAYLYHAWRLLPEGASLVPLVLGFAAAVFGSLVSGLLDHTLLTYPHAVALLWLTLGLGAVSTRLSSQSLR